MWLLPAFSPICRVCLGIYYRLEVDGPPPPERGPVILVANHPNSLLDPACVVAFAERPVRFLAKAPLFDQKDIGWLIRAAGSIPVYRRQDDPTRIGENDQTFRAAEDALVDGAAVGIFPEGITHDEPQLSTLKTGFARIALGTALRFGSSFPIIPIGLSFPEKAIFRSDALVIRGEPVHWSDVAGRRVDDVHAVRELTQRVDHALRSVTLNLEQWEDREIVLGAEAIFAAELGLDPSHSRRMDRLRLASERLRELRTSGSSLHEDLADGVRRHMMRLDRLRLAPSDLVGERKEKGSVLRGSGAQGVLGTVLRGLGIMGGIMFYPPYRLTGLIERRLSPDRTAAATYKLLAGILTFTLWYLLLVIVASVSAGWLVAAAFSLLLPPLGIATLWTRDRSKEVLRRAQRGRLLRQNSTMIESMRQRQALLAEQLRSTLARDG